MTPLQQTALDFCREVMGWDAKSSTMFSDTLMVLRDGERQAWRYTDLNAVLGAVRGWCEKHASFRRSLGLSLTFGARSKRFHASIKRGVFIGHYTCDDPCLALMQACVAANRKLKGHTDDQ